MPNDPSPYDLNLDKGPANYTPLSPLSFLKRSAFVYPAKTAVIHGNRRYSYEEFYDRCRRLASSLNMTGVKQGDTVAILAPNVPELLEAHYGVPMLGAVLNAINIRLDAPTVAFILEHGNAKVLIADTEFQEVITAAITTMDNPPLMFRGRGAHASAMLSMKRLSLPGIKTMHGRCLTMSGNPFP